MYSGAFAGCTSVTSVTIGSGLHVLRSGVFSGCSMTSVNIPDNVTDVSGFSGCKNLKYVIIGNGAQSISANAFSGCENLTSVTIGSGMTQLGGAIFSGCENLKDVYCYTKKAPQTIVKPLNPEEDTFADCYIEDATLHILASSQGYVGWGSGDWSEFGTVEYIGSRQLTYVVDGEVNETITIEDGREIKPLEEPTKEGYTFSGWSGIPTIMPAKDVKVTGTFTVNKYTLTYIVDGETYKTYEVEFGKAIIAETAPTKNNYTFSGWSGIPTTMPAKDVTVTGTFTANSVEYVDKASVEIDGIFYRLSAKSRSAEVIAGTTKYTGTVNIPATVQLNGAPYSVTSIGTIAFKDCSALTSVKIPEGITSIGIGAFTACTSLSSVSLPNSITEIGNSVFWGCKGLESINIPSSVTNIGEFAFVDAGLTSLTIPSSVQSIQQHAFQGCKGLTNVTIPGNVVSIDEYAFCGCDNLSSITLENGVTNIGERVFMSCGNLETVVLPNSLEVIGPYAFAGCNQMRTMDMPNSVTTLGDGAFLQCANLETVKLSAGIKTMGTYIFQKCYNLNSVIIPGIKTLTEGMFMNCSNLIQVEMTEGVESLGLGVFYHCTNLPSITIPQSVKSIGQRVFEGCENLTSVTVLSNTPATLTSSSFENASKSVLYVPKGSQNTYQSAAYWKNFALIVEPYYILTYMIDDEVYKTVNVNYGESITPEAEPTKEGYTFSGWGEIPATMPPRDVTITGSFAVNNYTLTYQVDGETYKSYDIEYGANITAEAEPTKEGYTFSGWSEIPSTMPAHDVTITGNFTFIDAIDDVIADDGTYQIFTLDGKPVESLQKGVNIIRYENGTTKSVYVK